VILLTEGELKKIVEYRREQFNKFTQHATAIQQSTMGLVGELTKISKSMSTLQGEQQKNIIELFKLVADIQNPTVPMDDRFKKIHESVDRIHDSYKATTQVLSPSTTSGGYKSRRNNRNSKRNSKRRR
jgi:hypothetical protein